MAVRPGFVWPDLSTFDLDGVMGFYSDLFGWSYRDDGDAYMVGMVDGGKESAGIYTMPKKFEEMGMPSFWMSYVRVDDLDATVAKSERLGGKIEVRPTEFGVGRVALIRDPSGAGFTAYEGRDMKGRDLGGAHGRMVWNELYVSSIEAVREFYEKVFGWVIKKDRTGTDRYEMFDRPGEAVASIQVLSNDIKGDKEFWGIYFSVDDMEDAKKTIKGRGGKIIHSDDTDVGESLLVQDPCGAVFYLIEGQKEARGALSLGSIKWRAALGIGMVYVAIMMDWPWFWGFVFLAWAIPDLKTGHTYFFEMVGRKKSPVMYWVIVLSWLWMAVYLISGLFYGEDVALF